MIPAHRRLPTPREWRRPHPRRGQAATPSRPPVARGTKERSRFRTAIPPARPGRGRRSQRIVVKTLFQPRSIFGVSFRALSMSIDKNVHVQKGHRSSILSSRADVLSRSTPGCRPSPLNVARRVGSVRGARTPRDKDRCRASSMTLPSVLCRSSATCFARRSKASCIFTVVRMMHRNISAVHHDVKSFCTVSLTFEFRGLSKPEGCRNSYVPQLPAVPALGESHFRGTGAGLSAQRRRFLLPSCPLMSAECRSSASPLVVRLQKLFREESLAASPRASPHSASGSMPFRYSNSSLSVDSMRVVFESRTAR